jgi:hypothetical protein
VPLLSAAVHRNARLEGSVAGMRRARLNRPEPEPASKRPRLRLGLATASAPPDGSGNNGITLNERVLLQAQDSVKEHVLDDAAIAFRKSYLSRWALGRFSNLELTELSYYATQAGSRGVADLAVNPVSRGRNHARCIRKVLGLAAVLDKLYYVNIPLWDKVVDQHCT